MIGGQTKTPTLSVLFDKKTDYVGGAGIVAKHLKQAQMLHLLRLLETMNC